MAELDIQVANVPIEGIKQIIVNQNLIQDIGGAFLTIVIVSHQLFKVFDHTNIKIQPSLKSSLFS